jgi:hypothetical protein
MKKALFVLCAISTFSAFPARSQTTPLASSVIVKPVVAKPATESRMFFPKNWIRGYVDYQVAPSHNEPDLGRCAFPQPASAGGAASTCTAYARYLISGYVELQPLGRTPARHIFIFIQPTMSFGRNIPQITYAASMEPIAFDRSVGIGFQLPKNFELRATQHQVDYLGRYANPLGPADLHTTNGPYGLYATVGVRWSFGGYGRQGAPAAY